MKELLHVKITSKERDTIKSIMDKHDLDSSVEFQIRLMDKAMRIDYNEVIYRNIRRTLKVAKSLIQVAWHALVFLIIFLLVVGLLLNGVDAIWF